jgi:hypothetical protein
LSIFLAEQRQHENEEFQRQLEETTKLLAADLYEKSKKYPNHYRTHWQDKIPPNVAAEIEKLAAANADRDYAQRDPAREQIAWEDALAKAAIEKEKKDRQFVEPKPEPAQEKTHAGQQQPPRARFGDVLITRAAETAMNDPRQQHGEPLFSAPAFRDALEKNRLALACVTPDEAAKSHRESKFAKEVGRYAPVYQPGEIVIMREPRNDGNTDGRVHRLDQTKGEDYLRCLGIDKSQLQGIEATKGTLDERAQNRQRAIDAASLRKARSRSRSPQRRGLVSHQAWIMQRLRDAQEQWQQQDRRDYSEKQKREGAEPDTERYRSDPEYRRQMQNTYRSPEEKKRDRETTRGRSWSSKTEDDDRPRDIKRSLGRKQNLSTVTRRTPPQLRATTPGGIRQAGRGRYRQAHPRACRTAQTPRRRRTGFQDVRRANRGTPARAYPTRDRFSLGRSRLAQPYV